MGSDAELPPVGGANGADSSPVRDAPGEPDHVALALKAIAKGKPYDSGWSFDRRWPYDPQEGRPARADLVVGPFSRLCEQLLPDGHTYRFAALDTGLPTLPADALRRILADKNVQSVELTGFHIPSQALSGGLPDVDPTDGGPEGDEAGARQAAPLPSPAAPESPSLSLFNCLLEGELKLAKARTKSLSIFDCVLTGNLIADGIDVSEDIDLQGLTIRTPSGRKFVKLTEAKIGGIVVLDQVAAFEIAEDGSERPSNLTIHLTKSQIGKTLYVSDLGISHPTSQPARRMRRPLATVDILAGACVIQGEINGSDAAIGTLNINKAKVEGGLSLSGCWLDKVLRATGAVISGEVYLADLTTGPRASVNFYGARVGSMWVSRAEARSLIRGHVNLTDITINGDLTLDALRIRAPTRMWAISAANAKIAGRVSVAIQQGGSDGERLARPHIVGGLDLARATIGTDVVLTGALISGAGGKALSLFDSRVGGRLDMDGSPGDESAAGKTPLVLTRMTGQVDIGRSELSRVLMAGCWLSTETGSANIVTLNISEATVNGTVDGTAWWHPDGRVGLPPVVIDGMLDVSQATFRRLDLRGAALKVLRKPGTPMDDRYEGRDGSAIEAEGARIEGDVKLGRIRQFTTRVDGAIRLDRTIIDGDLEIAGLVCRGISSADPADFPLALSLRNVTIKGDLIAADARDRTARKSKAKASSEPASFGLFDLSGARFRALNDNNGAGWGPVPRLRRKVATGVLLGLSGTRFERFDAADRNDLVTPCDARAEWLRRQYANGRPTKRAFDPHAYLQTARAFDDMGLRRDAREIVKLERQDARKSGRESRWLNAPIGLLFGHGMGPSNAAVTLLLYTALCWGLAVGAVQTGRLVNSNVDGQPTTTVCDRTDPLPYAIDVVIPAVDLGREALCQPAAFPKVPKQEAMILELTKLLLTLGGGLILIMAALTFAGVLRRDRTSI